MVGVCVCVFGGWVSQLYPDDQFACGNPLSLPLENQQCRWASCLSGMYVGPRDPNSSPAFCVARTLLSKPSLWPYKDFWITSQYIPHFQYRWMTFFWMYPYFKDLFLYWRTYQSNDNFLLHFHDVFCRTGWVGHVRRELVIVQSTHIKLQVSLGEGAIDSHSPYSYSQHVRWDIFHLPVSSFIIYAL